jgi:hypothetical protein
MEAGMVLDIVSENFCCGTVIAFLNEYQTLFSAPENSDKKPISNGGLRNV